jgi:hypothetical protein
MNDHSPETLGTSPSRALASHARLLVPFVASVLVAFALNASWHAIQKTLRMLEAPGELVLALPVILEPAALIYAGVWLIRKRVGGEVRVVRALFFVLAAVAVVYNVAFALPLEQLLPPGSIARMAALAVSAALAPLTVITVGHTALEEWSLWRASRRNLVDDIHDMLEAKAQEVVAEALAGEFEAEVREKVLAQMRAGMKTRLGLEAPRSRRKRDRQVARPVVSVEGVSVNGHKPDGGDGQATPALAPVPDGFVEQVRSEINGDTADAVRAWVEAGNDVNDRKLTGHLRQSLDGISDRSASRYASKVRELAGAR